MLGASSSPGPIVAVTADRRRHEQAVLLERLGVEVVMFPLLRTEPEDDDALRSLTKSLGERPPAYLVANTGYGMRTWLALAAHWGLQDALVHGLGREAHIAARGAKALGELRKVGLDAWYKAPGETLDEVVGRLLDEDLHGATVAVQLHGEAPGPVLERLATAAAELVYVPVYRMADSGRQAAEDLVGTIVRRQAHAVTFTAAPQVQVMAGAAQALGLSGALLDAFNSGEVVAACIGPVCAEAARAAGIREPLVPEHARLGSLASSLGTFLASRGGEAPPSAGPAWR
jgi:uroporphyrinogen-III synthase